jgi:hypothetical protein
VLDAPAHHPARQEVVELADGALGGGQGGMLWGVHGWAWAEEGAVAGEGLLRRLLPLRNP